jgi:hypothetical protein
MERHSSSTRQVDRVHPNRRPAPGAVGPLNCPATVALEAIRLVLQLQQPAGTDVGAHAAADAKPRA